MSGTWSQGGQNPGSVQINSGPFQGPPPICFKCGGEHYVVACPQQAGSVPTGPPSTSLIGNQQNGSYGPNGASYGPRPQYGNSQNGYVPNRFPNPRAPPVVTRYAVPGVNPQIVNTPGYGPPVATPQYHQYPGSVPPVQSYPPQQQPVYAPNPPHYVPYVPPPTYNQPPQSYGAPPYSNSGYQPPPTQNQYPQRAGPPQYSTPVYNNPPQSYAPPPAVSPFQPSNSYPPQTNSYPGPSPAQSQAPQWNNTTPVTPYTPSPFPQTSEPNNPVVIKREFSGTPRQQPASQSNTGPQPSQYPEHGSERQQQQQTSQTAAFLPMSTQPTAAPMDRVSSVESSRRSSLVAVSKASSALPASRPTSSSSNHLKDKGELGSPSVKAMDLSDSQMEDDIQYEDGELTEEDIQEQEFDWELKKIFFEQPATENVCLAQPLSTTWESTPVPLLDQRLNNSVSRYARKENLKDFMRPIRSQPQWSYLQEDPAFSDLKLDGQLIPLEQVPAWMAARQGVDLSEFQKKKSRKRARTEEEVDEQEDVDNQIKLEAASEHHSGNKRQKHEEHEHDEDTIIVQGLNTPTGGPGTPTLARLGTPSFGTEDDVWAPQPGECASTPLDPTEALLASLGVSGSPKPVQKPSGPPVLIPGSESGSPSMAGVPQSMSPRAEQNPVQPNLPQHSSSVYISSVAPQEFSPSYGSSPQGPTQSGQFVNGTPQHGNTPCAPQPYNPPRQNSYGNGISSQGNPPYTNQHFGMPRQNSFGNRIPPQGNQPYGLPQQNSYRNNTPLAQPPYSNHQNMMPQQQHPSHSQYTPPQVNGPYGPAQANASYPPQYNAQFPNPYYGMPMQQHLPPNQYNNGIPPHFSGLPPHTPASYSQSNFANQQNGMPQQSNQSHGASNNNLQGYGPPRQDSGYISARGSYSNGSNSNHGLPSMPSEHQEQQSSTVPAQSQPEGQLDASKDTSSAPKSEEANFFDSLPSQFPRKEKSQKAKVEVKTNGEIGPDNEQGESPLTPTSMEILGKLIPNNESGGKKVKRPQPVVAAAYSRRW